MELVKISREELKDDCFIVKIGSEDRPATEKDIEEFEIALTGLFHSMKLDFIPPVLITHHAVSFETISREQTRQLVNSFLDK